MCTVWETVHHVSGPEEPLERVDKPRARTVEHGVAVDEDHAAVAHLREDAGRY